MAILKMEKVHSKKLTLDGSSPPPSPSLSPGIISTDEILIYCCFLLLHILVLYMDPDWTYLEFLQAASQRLEMVPAAKRMFNADGIYSFAPYIQGVLCCRHLIIADLIPT